LGHPAHRSFEVKRVSVVIPNWNGKHLLGPCLDSLAAQTHPDVDVIVVDNASRDGSVEFVRSSYPKVRLVELQKNLGFAKASNLGVEASTGEIIAFLNNDTVCHTDWAAQVVKGLDRDDVGFMASKILYMEAKDTINAAGDMVLIDGTALQIGRKEKDTGQYDEPRFVFTACGAASAYKREVLDRVGVFDERFYFLFEDVDLGFRAQLAGYKCLYLPSAVVWHHASASLTGKWDKLCVFHGNKNEILILAKNMPGRLLRRYFWTILWRHIRIIASHFKRGLKARPFSAAWAKVVALWMLPSVLKDRRRIQAMKVVSDEYIDSMLVQEVPEGYILD
jgi:GT2 family glycosyltransferase